MPSSLVPTIRSSGAQPKYSTKLPLNITAVSKQYFKRTSTDQLTAKFKPVVKKETAKLKLADQYNKFAGKAASAGLVDKQNADVDSYVTQKAMDGLFLMIAEEEKKLRANPMGAGSDLLKNVFGALN